MASVFPKTTSSSSELCWIDPSTNATSPSLWDLSLPAWTDPKLSLQSDKAARLMLMKIHVIGLDEEHLAFYRRKFPGSVVTSICAVDIHKLSYIPDEREVLLRGPFFQVLQLHEGGELLSGRPVEVLEMVMLNSNRDHLTSVQMQEEQQATSRRLFGTMATVSRCQSCVRYCRDHGLVEDEAEYRILLG